MKFFVFLALFVLQTSININRLVAQDTIAIQFFNRGIYKLNYNRDTLGALEDFNKSIDIDPTGVNSIFNRGLLYACNKQYRLALLDFDKGIELYPNMANLYGNRGNVRALLSDIAGAIEDYKRAAQLQPKDPLPYLNIGNLQFNRKEYNSAINSFNKSIEIDSTCMICYVRRADTKRKLKNYTSALVDIQNAISIAPNYGESYSLKGSLEYLTNKKNTACESWEKAVKLGFSDAKEFLNTYCQ